ncbi:MAG TPA: glycosyltransferase family 4 protein [Pseudolabrys sp.]|nr:glycosyltransferase family 4 protein [Pseudolabrys sp.]
MRIAQIAPLYESVPPRFYGGTERVVSYLTEELVRQGHDVTLFASGDSKTSARLVRCCDMALRLNPSIRDPLPYHIIMMEQVRQRAHEFDILHFHVDYLHAPLIRELSCTALTTHHGRLDLPDLTAFYGIFHEMPLVSISNDQRRYLPRANWIGTVHHGLPTDLLPFAPRASGGYLVFLGRISPEKRPDLAIEIASRAGVPLKIAAKIDRADQDYWDKKIHPMIGAHANVEFIGEIAEREKARLLGEASALLFPVDWPEPFGLVMIEAMACGTPVIALRRGSVPEVVEAGLSGFVVDSVEEAISAVRRVTTLRRATVRAAFERRFTAERMANDYVDIYHRLIGSRSAVARLRNTTDRIIRMPVTPDGGAASPETGLFHHQAASKNAPAS